MEKAREVLARELRTYPASFRRAPLVFRGGRYDFHQLQRWKTRLHPARLPEPVFAGIALEHNRLVVGVLDLSATPKVLKALRKVGISSSAVVVERAEPIRMEVEQVPLDWPEF